MTQTAGSGTTQFDGTVTATLGNIAVTSNVITVNALLDTATAAAGGLVTLNADTGALTLASAGDIDSDGAVSLTGAGGIATAADIDTTNDGITFSSATTLTGNVLLDSGAGAGTIAFLNTLEGTNADTESLGLTAGTGNVDLDNTVGGSTSLGTLTITSAAALTADNTIDASQCDADGRIGYDAV